MKDVPPYTIVGGVPSKPIRRRFALEIEQALLALAWWDWEHDKLHGALPDFRALPVQDFIRKYS